MCEYCDRGKAIIEGVEPTPFGDHEQAAGVWWNCLNDTKRGELIGKQR